MSTFNSFTWGGTGTGGGSVGTQLANLINPMLRMAGITVLPGTTPSEDQTGELVPMVNRMLSSWNLDGHKIYNAAINQFEMVDGQKEYAIGPGGELDMERPLYIKIANVILPTSPTVRWPMAVYDDYDWGAVSIQDLNGAPPYALYYDGALDPETGLGKLSVIFQPPSGYTLELYTWQRLSAVFTSIQDVAVFPDGYEKAIVSNGALETIALNPLESKLTPLQMDLLAKMAAKDIKAVRTLNAKIPSIGCDPALTSTDGSGNGRPWISGPFG